jgi:hypothetical protein
VFAVVVSFSFPRRSQGTGLCDYRAFVDLVSHRGLFGSDYVCSIEVLDPSVSDMSGALTINWFGSSPETCPRPKMVGDIIRAHRVSIQQFEGRLQVDSHLLSTKTALIIRILG